MAGQQSLFDFPGARLELVQPLSVVRSYSSEEALDLEFTEKTLHNLSLFFHPLFLIVSATPARAFWYFCSSTLPLLFWFSRAFTAQRETLESLSDRPAAMGEASPPSK
jgi:hypothetical protein